MYAFFPIALVLVGAALILVVLIRKIPALNELPEDQQLPGRKVTAWALKAVKQIDWQRYQRFVVKASLAFIERLRRMSVKVARLAENGVKQLRGRMSRLSGDGESQESPAFSSRIKKRSAFLEEERQLIDKLTANPDDTDAYRRLANLYTLAGNVRDAKAAWRELLRHDPDNESAKAKLVELDGGKPPGMGT